MIPIGVMVGKPKAGDPGESVPIALKTRGRTSVGGKQRHRRVTGNMDLLVRHFDSVRRFDFRSHAVEIDIGVLEWCRPIELT